MAEDYMTTDAPDDGSEMTIELEEGSEEGGEGGFDDDDPNLVPFFEASEKGQEFLKKVSRQVCDDFDEAWESSEEYREKRAANFKMMVGMLPPKEEPFAGCANAHAPFMLERILRLTSNVFVEIFANKEDIFTVSATGPDDAEKADLLSRHGNWQVKNDMPDFLRQNHRALIEFFSTGSVFCHSYFDPVKNRNRHDILTCDDFVIPYVFNTVETDLSDVPFKIRILRKYKQEIEQLGLSDWANTDKIFDTEAGNPNEDPDANLREEGAKWEGIVPSDEGGKNSPYKLYEYHGWTVMPGSDVTRPIVAIVEPSTKTMVRLYIREEDDWKDRARFDRETLEWQQYQQDLSMFQDLQSQEASVQARLSMPDVDPQEAMILQQGLQQAALQPPIAPRWLKSEQDLASGPKPIRKTPMEMFSHGVCIENPNGALGLSYGSILADQNRLADEALNRFYDAATLGNCYSIMVPEMLGIDKGTIPFGPGKVVRVKNVTGDQLKSSIVELRPSAANPQLLDIARMSAEWGDGVTVSGIVSGEAGKSGETYRGVATRLERATRQLSVAGSKYLDFLSNVLRNNAKLNSIFMNDVEVFEVTNDLGFPETKEIGRKLYLRDYRVNFTADVRFSSQAQKVQEADEILGMVTTLPPLQANPSFVYEAIKQSLIARGKKDMIPLLGPPPPPPQVPFGTPPPPPPGMMPPGMEPGGGEAMPPAGEMGPPPESNPPPQG
jgi:hypothetical protein